MHSLPTTLIAATANGIVRLGQQESGAWSQHVCLDGEDVRCLARHGSILYAGLQGGGVLRSEDGAITWEAAGLQGQIVKSLAVGDQFIYAGTKEPRVHVSGDGGNSWRPLARFSRLRSWWWAQPAEKPFRPSYVSALSITDQGILAGVEACGVLLSTDAGATWKGHRPGALRDCHEIHSSERLVIEAGSGGMAASYDGGRTWRRPRHGLDRRYGWSAAIGSDAVYLAAAFYRSAHTGDAQACIFRAEGDRPWQKCSSEMSSLPRLAARGNKVFAALRDGTILRYPGEGNEWEPLPAGIREGANALLALD